jgi:FkbM family methyltransferase
MRLIIGGGMSFLNFIRTRLLLVRRSQWSWHLLGDSLRLGGWGYKATAKKSGLSLNLISGRGEWFTFHENLIREDYLRGLVALREGDRVIDIGANIGAFTVLAASKVGPKGQVYAFEPDPQVCDRLKQNLRLNGLENVTVYEGAVGAKSGHAVFYQHQKNAYSSLHDAVDGRVQEHKQSFQVTLVGIREVIKMVGLPSGIALLKVDCEGSEYDIFNAMDADSAAHIQQISMELHPTPANSPDQLIDRLTTLGFKVGPTYPSTPAGEKLQKVVLAVRA